MSTFTLTDAKIMLGGYNLSAYHNQISVEHSAEMLDDTVFGTSGTRSAHPGLKTVKVNGTVLWDTTLDGVLYLRIGATREVMSYAAFGNTVGDFGFMTRGVNAEYNPQSGEVGQLMSSQFTAEAANTPLVRGQILIPILPALTANGTSTIVQLGAVTALQRIYSALHVFAPIGGTGSPGITVTIESAALIGFGSPTTRLTHTTINSVNQTVGDWQEAAGPITDQFWRAKWVLTGTTPSFIAYLTLGIQ